MIQIDNAVPMPTQALPATWAAQEIKVHVVNGPRTPHPDDFTVEFSVPMPSKAKAAKMDKGLRKIVDRYNEAHMKVYGMIASVTYEKPWLRVSGIDSRVSRQRLLEMARQLEYRIGE